MVRLDPQELHAFVSRIYEEFGADGDVADDVARSLVGADLRGHNSHGVRLTPLYEERVEKGLIDPTARPTMEQDGEASAVVDGRSAFGRITGGRAVDVGAPKAHEYGVSVVGVRNGAHLGRIGEWAERAAADGVAFLGFVCNPASELVAPPGRTSGKLSTNPIALGLPSFDALEHPVVVDVATSQVAHGKITDHAARREPLPEEWVTAYDGQPDASRFLEEAGALLPLGGTTAGYKGFGLATLCELLAGTVGDAFVSGQREASWGNVAAFFFVDPLRFSTRTAIEDRIRAFERHVKSPDRDADADVGIAARGDELLLPGESEHVARTDGIERGVSINDEDAGRLRTVAERYGLGDAVPEPLRER